MDAPTITDWIQALAAAVGAPGVLIVIWLFMRKDKEGEKEIESLISIASQLTKLISISEARYADVRKPIIEFTAKLKNPTFVNVPMKNINPKSKLKKYVCEVKDETVVANPTGVLESGNF